MSDANNTGETPAGGEKTQPVANSGKAKEIGSAKAPPSVGGIVIDPAGPYLMVLSASFIKKETEDSGDAKGFAGKDSGGPVFGGGPDNEFKMVLPVSLILNEPAAPEKPNAGATKQPEK